MRPMYQISLDGNDITLDDRDGMLDIPAKGRSLEVFLGYQETGIQSMGQYVIDTIKLTHKPSIMTIGGHSADMSKDTLKQHRNENYEQKSFKDVATSVAGRNGLQIFVDPSLDASQFSMLHQTDESDMHFMNRLARDHDALFKIAGGMMILSKRGSATSASGSTIGVTVTPGMVKPGSVIVSYSDRSKYESANSYWFNTATAQREISSTAGSGAAGFFLRHPLTEKAKAQAAASARLTELQRAQGAAEAELALGDPSVTASGKLTLSGFRTGIDGDFSITSVEHNYDSAGYTTKISADNQTA